MEERQYSSQVITLTRQSSVHDALVLMQANFIKRIVIIHGKKPVGIVTERDISRFLEQDTTKRTLREIPIKEIMGRNVITVSTDTMEFLRQCASRMIAFKIGAVVIVDENGNLAGITTQTDIAKTFADTCHGKYKVKDYMSDKVVTCRESDYLSYTLEILNKNNVSRLVVTDNAGKVKGIITTNTFMKHSSYFKDGKATVRDYLLSKDASSLRVEQLLGKEVLTVEPDEDLATAASLMLKNNISGIPVISQKKLVGITTKFDVVKAFDNVVLHDKVLREYREPR